MWDEISISRQVPWKSNLGWGVVRSTGICCLIKRQDCRSRDIKGFQYENTSISYTKGRINNFSYALAKQCDVVIFPNDLQDLQDVNS